MKDVKLFLSIATIFVLMSMLIGCDVFDPNNGGRLGGDLNNDGRLYDAVLGRDNTSDPETEDAPNPKEELDFMPPAGSKPPTSKFIFFPTDYLTTAIPRIYVVIPNIMDPTVDTLYLLGDEDVLKKINYRVYGDSLNIGNTRSMNKKLKTIPMMFSADAPITGVQGSLPSEYFYIEIPADLEKFTRPDWIQSDPSQSLFRGFRMEFVNRAEPDDWDDCRISFVGIKKRSGMVMPYSKDEFFKDPYANQNDDYGNWFQIRLNFDNRKKYHVPPPT